MDHSRCGLVARSVGLVPRSREGVVVYPGTRTTTSSSSSTREVDGEANANATHGRQRRTTREFATTTTTGSVREGKSKTIRTRTQECEEDTGKKHVRATTRGGGAKDEVVQSDRNHAKRRAIRPSDETTGSVDFSGIRIGTCAR